MVFLWVLLGSNSEGCSQHTFWKHLSLCWSGYYFEATSTPATVHVPTVWTTLNENDNCGYFLWWRKNKNKCCPFSIYHKNWDFSFYGLTVIRYASTVQCLITKKWQKVVFMWLLLNNHSSMIPNWFNVIYVFSRNGGFYWNDCTELKRYKQFMKVLLWYSFSLLWCSPTM